MQWPVEAESGSVEHYELGDVPSHEPVGVVVVRTAALLTPGTLINYTDLLAPRLAEPTVTMHQNDAANLQLAGGETVTIEINGKPAAAQVKVNGHAPEGVALLRGVPYQAATAELKLSKIED